MVKFDSVHRQLSKYFLLCLRAHHLRIPPQLFVKSFSIFWFIFFCVPAVFSQNNDESKSRIDRLRGGVLGMKFKWSGSFFSGLGARADAMGGSISTLNPGAESISSNPAALGFAHGFHITLDWAPPLTIDPGGIFGIQDQINESLMETAKNNSPEGVVAPGTVTDAVVNSELDMRGGLKGGALLYGNPLLSVAAAFHQPFRMESQINMSGIEFLAVALDDDGKETNRIFGTVNGNFNLGLNFETSSLGIGTRLFPNLAVGMVYDNINGESNFESTFLPEGIISKGDDIRAFNDPRRIQYDSLYAIIKGDWEGSGHRFRWGVGYHPKPNLSLDAALALPFTVDLRGPFTMVHNTIRALNLGAEGDEEVFDVDILVEDNLTKTVKRVTRVPGVDFEIPGSLSLGFTTRWDNYLASVVYIKYFEPLAYRLSYDQFDSVGVPLKGGEIHQGIDLGSAFRLGIGVEPLILGLGVVFGETFRTELVEFRTKTETADRSRIFLPFFSLGGGVKLGPRFRLDYVLNFYNSSFLRFSTSYRL